MTFYARINQAGIVDSVVESERPIEGANIFEVQDYSVLLKKRVGNEFVEVPKTAAESAAEKLLVIDRITGMSRLLRESLIGIAGANAPASLVAKETEAAAERVKLK
jgi:hypothetical protein